MEYHIQMYQQVQRIQDSLNFQAEFSKAPLKLNVVPFRVVSVYGADEGILQALRQHFSPLWDRVEIQFIPPYAHRITLINEK